MRPRHPFREANRPYFTTAATKNRQIIFADPAIAELFKATLYLARDRYSFLLLSFVIMPDHFHAVIVPANQNSIWQVMRFIKGGFAAAYNRELGRVGSVWQEGFYERAIRGEKDLSMIIAYIEENPLQTVCAQAWQITRSRQPTADAHPIWSGILTTGRAECPAYEKATPPKGRRGGQANAPSPIRSPRWRRRGRGPCRLRGGRRRCLRTSGEGWRRRLPHRAR